MPSIGELFVELGVVGDVKPLEKAIGTMKEAVKQIDNEIKANQRLLKYLQDIKNARNASEKALIKQNFAKEIQKQKMLDEIDSNQKAVDGKKELAANIAGVVKGVGLFVGTLTGAAVALNNLTNSLVSSNQAMLDLTRTTDIAQGTFQKWGSIGKMLGVENADQQLASLNQRLFDLMLTGEGARGFQLAGINPMGQDAEGVMEQLRARISGMNDTTATYLLQQMGIDPKMLHLLRMAREDFEALNNTIKDYQLLPEQTKAIQAMNIQLQIAGIKLKYLKDKAILAIMPAWNQFMASLARVTEGLSKTVQYVTEFISKSPELQNALRGIAVALGIIFAVAHPLLALFGALYLIIDDVMAYFNGGGSMIGVFMKKLDDYKEELKDKFGDLSLDKVIPQVILDVGEVIIKAGKVSLDIAKEQIAKYMINKGHLPGPLAGPAALYGLGLGYFQNLKEIHEQYGTVTGGAAPIDYNVKVELPEWVHNMVKEVAAGESGYAGVLPVINYVTPAMQRNLAYNTSNTTNTDNRQINQNISIQSSQPVFDIQNQLTYARNAMAAGWA